MLSVNSMPAMLADVRVDKTPQKKAEKETLTTSPERLGAIWERIPIWTPREPMLPNPYRTNCQRNSPTYQVNRGQSLTQQA